MYFCKTCSIKKSLEWKEKNKEKFKQYETN